MAQAGNHRHQRGLAPSTRHPLRVHILPKHSNHDPGWPTLILKTPLRGCPALYYLATLHRDTWGFLLMQTAAVRTTLHQEVPSFPRKKTGNWSCLQLISLTKTLISLFAPSYVQSYSLLQKAGKSRATQKGGAYSPPKHTIPSVNIFCTLHSLLHRSRDSASCMAPYLVPNH